MLVPIALLPLYLFAVRDVLHICVVHNSPALLLQTQPENPASPYPPMNPLTQIKNVQKVTRAEHAAGVSESASWHARFKHSAYIFAGGLPYDLTEGDVLAVFSQVWDCDGGIDNSGKANQQYQQSVLLPTMLLLIPSLYDSLTPLTVW